MTKRHTCTYTVLIALALIGAPSASAQECILRTAEGASFDMTAPVEGGDAQAPKLLQFLKSFRVSRVISETADRNLKKSTLKILDFSLSSQPQVQGNQVVALFQLASTPSEPSAIYTGAAEFGVAVVFVFHEMVHAVDTLYAARAAGWQKASMALSAEEDQMSESPAEVEQLARRKQVFLQKQNKMIFDAERKAYDAQRNLILEISQYAPCAVDYFATKNGEKKLITEQVTDQQIRDFYKLN